MTQIVEPGVWISWEGGENPAPGWKVMIRRRDGFKRRGWSETYDWTIMKLGTDIVEYQLLKQRGRGLINL